MKPPPIIETKRLTLRLPEQNEAEAVLEFFTRNREHLKPWNPVPSDAYYTIEFWEGALWDNINAFSKGESMRTFIFKKDDEKRPIGNANLSNIIRGVFHACHLGYNLSAEEQGNGFMTEAVEAIVSFGFEHLSLHRVMANYIPHNTASATVLEKAGFQKVGYSPDYLLIDGEWHDHVLTEKLNENWSL